MCCGHGLRNPALTPSNAWVIAIHLDLMSSSLNLSYINSNDNVQVSVYLTILTLTGDSIAQNYRDSSDDTIEHWTLHTTYLSNPTLWKYLKRKKLWIQCCVVILVAWLYAMVVLGVRLGLVTFAFESSALAIPLCEELSEEHSTSDSSPFSLCKGRGLLSKLNCNATHTHLYFLYITFNIYKCYHYNWVNNDPLPQVSQWKDFCTRHQF